MTNRLRLEKNHLNENPADGGTDAGTFDDITRPENASVEIGMQVRNSATPVQHADIGDTLLRSGGMQDRKSVV